MALKSFPQTGNASFFDEVKVPSGAKRSKEEVGFEDLVRATGGGVRRKKVIAPDAGAEQAKPEVYSAPPLILPDFTVNSRKVNNRGVEAVQYFVGNKRAPAFIDDGSSMRFVDKVPSDIEILAMLNTASKEYGSFELFGEPEFMQRAAILAGRYGFAIENEDLKSYVEQGIEGRELAAPKP
ncbi:MAG: LPD7 domain-containing protein [Sideroxyarcus sp.]|nr:LPD7 domain-containing protein [Sideroxyarcus sp.]